MQIHGPDHALKIYALLYDKLATPRGFDPIAIRHTEYAERCKCGSRKRRGDYCGSCNALWHSWDIDVPKWRRGKSNRIRTPGENMLCDYATLGKAFSSLPLDLRRVYWAHVVEGMGCRKIAEAGAKKWPDASVSWNRQSVHRAIGHARGLYAEALEPLLRRSGDL